MSAARIRVRAPARLHLGFLDLNGGLGRRFGSLGVALSRPELVLTIAPSPTLEVGDERLRRHVEAAAAHLGVSPCCSIAVESEIPAHAGFGSGTQLALAVAAGLAGLNDVSFDAVSAARALDRGNRSGVGLAAFTGGGFILDGGRDAGEAPPPLLARLPVPEDWRILLVLDPALQGVHGSAETEAFKRLPPFPAELAGHLCRLAIMRVLPALVAGDVDEFGRGIAEIQRRVGDHFAPVQGGRFTSPRVAEVLAALEARGITGVGQSSWGPTGFAFLGSAQAAAALARELSARYGGEGGLQFITTCGVNHGAHIETVAAREA
ncbi:beta-ribofuranosylaminobenzene 5'-phosphate synthase family protein [Chelatococcus sp. GCM10030263]|uniref:beta-ribofuranosylaminobenzene 5'-phosphate synthase family protein n=1 Tax=Chelatococcus sp. GCM10030263 TaxID=3273387 RepID=UPI003617E3BA